MDLDRWDGNSFPATLPLLCEYHFNVSFSFSLASFQTFKKNRGECSNHPCIAPVFGCRTSVTPTQRWNRVSGSRVTGYPGHGSPGYRVSDFGQVGSRVSVSDPVFNTRVYRGVVSTE